jgi:hypothetical protein
MRKSFPGATSRSGSGLAGAVGGGLDIRINDRFDIRAGQIDYNPAHLNGVTVHNVRFGAGLVIK